MTLTHFVRDRTALEWILLAVLTAVALLADFWRRDVKSLKSALASTQLYASLVQGKRDEWRQAYVRATKERDQWRTTAELASKVTREIASRRRPS